MYLIVRTLTSDEDKGYELIRYVKSEDIHWMKNMFDVCDKEERGGKKMNLLW